MLGALYSGLVVSFCIVTGDRIREQWSKRRALLQGIANESFLEMRSNTPQATNKLE